LEIVDRQFAGGEGTGQPRDPTQVGLRGVDDVYLAVRVVDPVDRDLVDAHPAALGQDEQFGVEEPRVVHDQGQQVRGDLAPDGLEPARCVGEVGGQGVAEHQVVAAGDELPLRAADHARPSV
jgi:hypothetical protein